MLLNAKRRIEIELQLQLGREPRDVLGDAELQRHEGCELGARLRLPQRLGESEHPRASARRELRLQRASSIAHRIACELRVRRGGEEPER